MKNVDEEFTSLLWKMPHHWFSEINAGVRVQAPIAYALHQAFCLTYGYEVEKYDSNILLPVYLSEKNKYLQILVIICFINSVK